MAEIEVLPDGTNVVVVGGLDDTSIVEVAAVIGPPGATGRGFLPRGTYSTNSMYAVDDIVTYDRETYRVTAAHSTGSTLDVTNLELWSARGDAGTMTIDSVITGTPGTAASVTNLGTLSDANLRFTLPRGDKGETGTMALGSVSTGAAGSAAVISNVGTPTHGIFNFIIPRGDKGNTGSMTVGSVTTGNPGTAASVVNSGTLTSGILDFTIPRGDKGATGTMSVGTVTTGAPASAASITNTGTPEAGVLNFTIPEGLKGDKGTVWHQGTGVPPNTTGAVSDWWLNTSNQDVYEKTGASTWVLRTNIKGATGTLSVGTVSTGAAGSSVLVNNTGTPSNAILNFTIPQGIQGIQGIQGEIGPRGLQGIQGIQGIQGDKGDAATIAVGTVTSTATGTEPTVTNTGTANDAVFSFTMPRGAGVKIGGATNQILSKASAADFDTQWVDAPIPLNMATTDTAQTISAVKTFSANPVVNNNAWTIAKTSGLQAALDSKYSSSNPPPAVDLSPYATLASAQTISGVKTFTARQHFTFVGTGPGYTDSQLEVYATSTGQSPRIAFHIGGVVAQQIGSDSGGLRTFSQDGLAFANFRAAQVFDSGNRVYSAGNTPPYPVTSVNSRTGAVTGLAEANAVVNLAGAQTITGVKTFSVAPVLPAAALPISATSGLQASLDSKYSAANPQPMTGYATEGYVTTRVDEIVGSAPGTLDTLNELAAALGDDPNFATTMTNSIATKVSLSGDETIAGIKTFSSSPAVPDLSFAASKLSATGTRSATTFLRGDNTWAAAPVTSVNGRTAAVTGLAEANAVVALTGNQTVAGVKTFSSIPVVPDASFAVAKLSATGTKSATTYLRGDNTWAALPVSVDSIAAGTNMSVSSSTGAVTVSLVPNPVFSSTADGTMLFNGGVADGTAWLYGQIGATPVQKFRINRDGGSKWTAVHVYSTDVLGGAIAGIDNAGSVFGTSVYDNGNRVYSSGNIPPSPTNMATVDTAQTISGAKTFTGINVLEGGTLFRHATGTVQILGVRTTPDAANRLAIFPNGTVNFGDGTAALDTVLYRSGVNALATNGTFAAAGVYDGANRVYSAANPPPAVVFPADFTNIPFHIGGTVPVGLSKPKFVAPTNMTLRSARSHIDTGTVLTYNIYVNGANVTGTAGGTGLYDFTDVNINAGDRVQVYVATSNATELSVTIAAVIR